MKTLVLGVGNELLADEGVGVHAMRRLQRDLGDPADIEFLDGGTLGYALAGAVAAADRLLVFDAARLDAAPGYMRLFRDGDMDLFLNSARGRSVHEAGLADLLSVARLTDSVPKQRALIAIQPAEIAWGAGPTPALTAALPAACAIGREVIEAWRHADRA